MVLLHFSLSHTPSINARLQEAGCSCYILITNLMHQLLFIHKIIFSSTCFEPQVLIFRRVSCTRAAYGTVTLYESSWWPVGTHLEWELTVGGGVVGGCLKTPINNLSPTVSSHSRCVPTGHPRTLIESDSTICCTCTTDSPEDEYLELETCRGEYYFMNK